MNITNNSKLSYNQEEKNIKNLKVKIFNLEFENATLRKKVVESKHFEKELSDAKEFIKQLNKEKYELMEQHNNEIKLYKREIEKLLNEKDFHQLNYNKRLTIFEQRMGKVNELEMENKVYREELLDLKEENKKLEEEKNNKLKEFEIKNQLRFKKIKNQVMNDLSETKENLLKLSLEHFDLKTQLIYLQNNRLLEDIDSQNKGTKKLIDEKKELKLKVLDLENQNSINEKIQLNLTNKLNSSKNYKKQAMNNKSYDLTLFDKKFKKHHKKYFNLKKNFIINGDKNKFLDSKIFNDNNKETNINKISIDNMPKSSNKKINIYNNNDSNSNSKDLKYIKDKSPNNTISKIKLNTTSKNEKYLNESNIIDKPKLKYKGIIDKKNFEIENLKLKIDNLKNRISFFINKYKKLYEFLEECLDKFFSELKGESNYTIYYDELIKFNFSGLNEKEKYGVLVLLMNYLLPIITFNYNSNFSLRNDIFKTNINIFDKNSNKTEKHLNDDILRKSFLGKNNKLQRDLFIKTHSIFNGTVPAFREKDISLLLDEHKIKDDKFKLVL